MLDFQTESLERYGCGSPCTAGDPEILDDLYGSNHLSMRRLRDGYIDNARDSASVKPCHHTTQPMGHLGPSGHQRCRVSQVPLPAVPGGQQITGQLGHQEERGKIAWTPVLETDISFGDGRSSSYPVTPSSDGFLKLLS